MTDDLNTPIRRLRYRLTRDDIAAFEFQPRELNGLDKAWFYGPMLAMGAAAGYFEPQLRTVLPWDVDSKLGQLLTVLIAIAIGYLISMVLLTARTRRRIARAQLPQTETTINVFPDLCIVDADGNDRSYVWSLSTVVDTATHIFLTSGTRPLVIIPLRAFTDAADMRAFATFARARGEEARLSDEMDDATDNQETAP